MKTTLYLARHGETHWNKAQRFQGQLDSELTEQGKLQSLALAEQVSDKSIAVIVSSSLGRALSTADLCQQVLLVEKQINDGLIERHLGVWQGQYLNNLERDSCYDEILRKFTGLAPQGGESAVNCGERVYHAMITVAQQYIGKNVLVIFHGEALRCLLLFMGKTYSDNAYHLFANGSLHELMYQSETGHFTYQQ